MATISTWNPVFLALIAGFFTWGMTSLGASLVVFFKNLSTRVTNIMLGFAAGVMIAASFWSLLEPAIAASEGWGSFSFFPALIGFLLGGFFLLFIDRITPHIHSLGSKSHKEGPSSQLNRTSLLVLAVTIHNIPEGLALGVAFGAIQTGDEISLLAAIILAIGIGIQNFPEGAAVSIPLRSEGYSRGKSFFYGQASAIVEPIFAVIGAALVHSMTTILPYALAFAAGAMVYVVSEELIPAAQQGDGADLATISLMIGFAVMMVLDVALG